MNKKFFSLLIIFATALILYHPVFSVYFSQDDFFHFKVSQTDNTFLGFLKLFGFYPFEERGIAFYRPLFREGLYNIYYSLFGLDILPFRLLSVGMHSINIFLVYTLIERLFRARPLALFVAFFFGISTPNVAILYYLAGGIQILGAAMFLLLSTLFFLKHLEGKGKISKLLSFLFFVLGLGSHENAAIVPIVLTGLVFIKVPLNKFLGDAIKRLWPFFVVLFVYLFLDIFKIGFSQSEEQYRVVFSPKRIFNSFVWYLAWALGIPEMLIDFVRPGLRLNPSLMRHWGDYYSVIFAFFSLSLFLLGIIFSYIILKGRRYLKDKRFWFSALWFTVSISPVLLLPLHKSAYYLGTGLAGFWSIIGFLVFSGYWEIRKKNLNFANLVLGGVITALVVFLAASIKIGEMTYWAVTRGKIARSLLDDVLLTYPQLPQGSVVYFMNDPGYPFVAEEWGGTSKQAAFILNNEDALQLLYKDPGLKVFYEDLGGVPTDFPKDKVYSLVARL